MARTTINSAAAAGTAGQFLELPPTTRRRKAPTTTTTTTTKNKTAAPKVKVKAKAKSSAGVKKTRAPTARKQATTSTTNASAAAAATAPSARAIRAARRAGETAAPISISSGASTPALTISSRASSSSASPSTFPPPSTTITATDLPSPLSALVAETIRHNHDVGRLVRHHGVVLKAGYLATTIMLRGLREQSRGWRVRLDGLVAVASVDGVSVKTLLEVLDGVGGVADEMWGVERGEGWFGEER